MVKTLLQRGKNHLEFPLLNPSRPTLPPSPEDMMHRLIHSMALVETTFTKRGGGATNPHRADAIRWVKEIVASHTCISSQTRDRYVAPTDMHVYVCNGHPLMSVYQQCCGHFGRVVGGGAERGRRGGRPRGRRLAELRLQVARDVAHAAPVVVPAIHRLCAQGF